jgi:DNA-binding Lrp family transcriptional regulator
LFGGIFLPQKMSVIDETRLRILNALIEKSVVKPNIQRIKAKTKYHLATIKSSLNFLEKEGIVTGYGPKINQTKLEHNLQVIELIQIDLSKEEIFANYLKQVKEDPHIQDMQACMGAGQFNIVVFHYYKDVESYHSNCQENYVKKVSGYYDLVKDKMVFYLTNPIYKHASRTDSILQI